MTGEFGFFVLRLYLLATSQGVCLHVGGVLLFLHMIYKFFVSVCALYVSYGLCTQHELYLTLP